LKDADDVYVECPIMGEALMVKESIECMSRWMIQKVKWGTYSTRDVIFIIRYVA
jgi:hypothetical protein